MKILNLLIAFILLINCYSVRAQPDTLKTSVLNRYIIDEQLYNCPMHVTLVQYKPGICSICGMKLVKTEQANMRTGVLKMYACPVHSFISSEKPGRCIKCGLNLIATNMAYCCSNHPAIASDWPGKCPECGSLLKLMPVSKIAGTSLQIYSCAIHKTVTSSIPVKCYSCGQTLTRSKL